MSHHRLQKTDRQISIVAAQVVKCLFIKQCPYKNICIFFITTMLIRNKVIFVKERIHAETLAKNVVFVNSFKINYVRIMRIDAVYLCTVLFLIRYTPSQTHRTLHQNQDTLNKCMRFHNTILYLHCTNSIAYLFYSEPYSRLFQIESRFVFEGIYKEGVEIPRCFVA